MNNPPTSTIEEQLDKLIMYMFAAGTGGAYQIDGKDKPARHITKTEAKERLSLLITKAEQRAVEANQVALAEYIMQHLKDGNLEQALETRLKELKAPKPDQERNEV